MRDRVGVLCIASSDMRETIGRLALTAVILCATAMPVSAATSSEFYGALLRRGVASYDAGRIEEATRQLRLAAFGLVESVPDYQTAHIYLALAHSKKGEESRARESARKVTAAERVERRYAALSLPSGVRSAFETLAARVLAQGEWSVLRGAATAVPPSTATTNPPSTATAVPPTTTAQPRGTSAGTTPANQPRTAVHQPQTTPQNSTAKPPQTAAQSQPATTTPPRTTQQQTTTSTPPRTQTPTTQTTQTPSQPATTQTTTAAPPPVTVDRVEVETQRATSPQAQPQQPQAQTQTQTQPQRTTETSRTQPAPVQPQPTPTNQAATPPRTQNTSPTAPILSPSQMASRLSSAERALDGANLTEARRLYRELLAAPNADRDTLIRTAEGLYRSRDFAATLSAFERIGTLRRGEEPYRYYIATRPGSTSGRRASWPPSFRTSRSRPTSRAIARRSRAQPAESSFAARPILVRIAPGSPL
jgi:hypothetical protein